MKHYCAVYKNCAARVCGSTQITQKKLYNSKMYGHTLVWVRTTVL